MFNITRLNKQNMVKIERIIDQKTKPVGSLGAIENLAIQMALLQSHDLEIVDKLFINKPTMLVFAGDHGIAEEGVSIAPSEVTQQMVHNFLNGGAAINCFCRSNNMGLKVIDAGILCPIDNKRLIQQSLGLGTKNFVYQKAMEIKQVEQGISLGASVVYKQIELGSNVIGFGEMGIANTSSATAIMAAILKIPVIDCVGRGTGIDDAALVKKVKLIEQSLAKHKHELSSPLSILACVGGFEIVQIIGGMLAAAEKKSLILVDGFIATTAALVATRINQNARAYMFFCHQSVEKGHLLLLEELGAKALLNLELRLGEGTGAALALPLLEAAASFFNDMASFESAGIKAV